MAKYRLQRLKAGRKHVFSTDSAADYLRCLIDEMAVDFNTLCDVSVSELGQSWMCVEVKSAPEAALLDRASEFRFEGFADELNHIFVSFFEVRATERKAVSRVWRVRHRKGRPWI